MVFFIKQKTAYAMRIIDWSSEVCSSDLIHDIHACQYVPKPDPSGYRELCERYAIDPCASLFFEDMARNLKPAKAIGMTTVWVNNGSEAGNVDAHSDFIDYETHDLAPFLDRKSTRLNSSH